MTDGDQAKARKDVGEPDTVRPDAPEQEPDVSLADMIGRWRREHIEVLRELQKTRVVAGNQRDEAERELESILTAVLDAIDSYRQMAAGIEEALLPEDKKARRIVKNFKLFPKQLLGGLRKFGVATMEVEPGAQFVAGLHRAVEVTDGPEEEDGRVAEVVRPGYYFKNRILRPADVIVVQAGAE